MSFYTSSIQTTEIQSNSHSNYRTEFKLGSTGGFNNLVYLTDMRLIDIGATVSGGAPYANRLTGLYSLIKRVELLDGDVSLDVLDNFNVWAGFKQFNKSNDRNNSQIQDLNKSRMGFQFQALTGAYDPGNPDDHLNQIVASNTSTSNSTLTTSDSTTPKAWLSLRDYIGFLSGNDYIPTKVFNNLRLIIEWDTNADVNIPSSAQTIVNISRPFLVVNHIVNEELKTQIENSWQGGMYRSIESAQVYSPGITADSTESYTLTGFNNKTVNRLLLAKNPTSTVSLAYGPLCSVNCLQPQEYQLQVSGANLLPGKGYTTSAQCLASVTDSWFDCNSIYLNIEPNNQRIVQQNNRCGWLAYVNFDVNQFVKQMVFKFSRTHSADDYYSQPLNLRLFGEVNRACIVNGDGSYNVRYI